MESTVAKMAHHRWFFEEKASLIRLEVLSESESDDLKLWIGNGKLLHAVLGIIETYAD
jgi:hypothetical protein